MSDEVNIKCACGHDREDHSFSFGNCEVCMKKGMDEKHCLRFKPDHRCIYCGRQAFTVKHNVCYNAAMGRGCDDPR